MSIAKRRNVVGVNDKDQEEEGRGTFGARGRARTKSKVKGRAKKPTKSRTEELDIPSDEKNDYKDMEVDHQDPELLPF
ncbi:hypothetical protein EVAR_66752_1 [Eumeta japonica]|uniref:Uncharacterized protein n=1 Tax=Eumeta variegata TaxID=151549 RepID=A0A4C1Z369_EUMVA|nr:hypothetical protein EVAR_66752_1 [Eumeta japonica]